MKSSSLMSDRQLYSSNKKVHSFVGDKLLIVHTAYGKAELGGFPDLTYHVFWFNVVLFKTNNTKTMEFKK